jgi:hypothetical protein
MKKRLNTLNEEINRMKSLFGSSRLYGNLVTEQVSEFLPPTELKNCEDVDAYDSTKDGGEFPEDHTGLVKYCTDGKANMVYSVKNGKLHGNQKEWDVVDGSLKTDDWYIDDNQVTKDEYENQNNKGDDNKEDDNKGDGSEEKKSSKVGLDMEGDPFEKGDAKSDREEVKLDVKDTKGDIKLNAKQCVQGMKNAWKSLSSGGDKDEWVKNNASRIKNIEWCLSNFGNRFEEDKLFGATDEANKLIKHLGLEKPELASGGAEGEKFIITNDRGRKRMVVKKVAPKKYRFRGFADISLFDRSSTKREKIFKPEYVGYIKKKLNLPDDTVITITKAVNTNKMDGGFFIID